MLDRAARRLIDPVLDRLALAAIVTSALATIVTPAIVTPALAAIVTPTIVSATAPATTAIAPAATAGTARLRIVFAAPVLGGIIIAAFGTAEQPKDPVADIIARLLVLLREGCAGQGEWAW